MLGALSRQLNLMELPFMTGVKGWIISLAVFAASIVISWKKEPVPNLFRGTFAEGDEVKSMILFIVTSLLFIWSLSNIFRLIEQSGIRVKEFARLGSLSLYIFIYHVFFGWVMSIIFSFSLKYEEVETPAVVIRSVVITLASLALSICAGLITEKIKAKAAAKKIAA